MAPINPPIEVDQRPESVLKSNSKPACRVLKVFTRSVPSRRQERGEGKGDEQRNDNGNSVADAHRIEELPDDAASERQRQEDHDVGHGDG